MIYGGKKRTTLVSFSLIFRESVKTEKKKEVRLLIYGLERMREFLEFDRELRRLLRFREELRFLLCEFLEHEEEEELEREVVESDLER